MCRAVMLPGTSEPAGRMVSAPLPSHAPTRPLVCVDGPSCMTLPDQDNHKPDYSDQVRQVRCQREQAWQRAQGRRFRKSAGAHVQPDGDDHAIKDPSVFYGPIVLPKAQPSLSLDAVTLLSAVTFTLT
jgi:hypothetical protein